MRVVAAAVLVWTGGACWGGRAPQPQLVDQAARGIPAIDEDGPRRYVTEKRDGLVELAPSGARQPIASAPIHWCVIDDKARVVWFTSSHGLLVFDLDDRQVVPIALDKLDDVTIVIDHGLERPSSDGSLSLVIEVSDTPALHSLVAHDAPPALRARREDLARLPLQDPAYVASLHARGAASRYSMRPCDKPAP